MLTWMLIFSERPEMLLSHTVDERLGVCSGRGGRPSGGYYKHGLLETSGGTGPVSGTSQSPAYLSNKEQEQVICEGCVQG